MVNEKERKNIYSGQNIIHRIDLSNALGLAYWYWLEIEECAHPQGLRFDSL